MKKGVLKEACDALAPNDDKCFCVMDAVFTSDSQWGTANNKDGSPSVGKRFNNPGNLRCISTDSPYHGQCVAVPSNGAFEKFTTLKQGVYAAVDVYARMYSGLPAHDLTFKWARTISKDYHGSVKNCF